MIEANTILIGDCLEQLKQLPDESIDCCVTSPPYFGLRDYGDDRKSDWRSRRRSISNALYRCFERFTGSSRKRAPFG